MSVRQIAFHGTSIQAATSIKSNGWGPTHKNWKESSGNPYVLYTNKEDEMDEAFQLAFTQASAQAMREPFVCKRAVMILDVTGKKLKPDKAHHDKWAFEVENKLYYYDVLAIWQDEWDISDFRPFYAFLNNNLSNHIKGPNVMSHTQKMIADNLQSFCMNKVHVPIVESYNKSRYYCDWAPKIHTAYL